MSKPLVTITAAAVEHLKNILTDPTTALKVSIDSRGCAGHKYRYDLVKIQDKNPLDIEIHYDWGLILLDNTSFMYLLGSTLDMKIDGFNSSLVWTNPNAESQCGCGESFSLKACK